jgi:hypothetical protein
MRLVLIALAIGNVIAYLIIGDLATIISTVITEVGTIAIMYMAGVVKTEQ